MARNPDQPVTRAATRKPRHRYHHGGLHTAAVTAALAALDAGRPLPSLRELAARCGVAHPSLYRHFVNAEALTLSVAAACFRDFVRHIEAAATREKDPAAALYAGCEASIRWGLAHPERYALMTGPELAGKQHHGEFFAAARETFDSLVRAVSACGVPDPIPVAHTIMCALHGLTDFVRKGRTIPEKAASIDEQIGSMVGMVVGYAAFRSTIRHGEKDTRPPVQRLPAAHLQGVREALPRARTRPRERGPDGR